MAYADASPPVSEKRVREELRRIKAEWETLDRRDLAEFIRRGIRPRKVVWARWIKANRRWLKRNFADRNWDAELVAAGGKSNSRRQKTARARTPKASAIWPVSRHAGLSDKKAAKLIARVVARIGTAIADGLLDPPKKPQPKAVDPVLLAVDRDRSIRALVGRVDVSGDNDGAAWAKIIQGALGRELHVYYRHGRDVLAELMAAVEVAIEGAGAKIRYIWKRIERARQFGGQAFVAIIPLMPEALPAATGRRTAKPIPRGKLSARSRVPA